MIYSNVGGFDEIKKHMLKIYSHIENLEDNGDGESFSGIKDKIEDIGFLIESLLLKGYKNFPESFNIFPALTNKDIGDVYE